ncbi:MAG: plasmid pRiA4b ORF-3 family protein [Defluviicoccus sp.]
MVVRDRAPKTRTPKTDTPKTNAGKTIVSLKITLRGIKPPIWRRLLMPDTMTLGDVHLAIQAAMGWEDDHLHAFDVGGRQYGDRQSVDNAADENRLTLSGVMKSGVTRFTYTYDFGDDWEHAVQIEKIEPALEGGVYPVCIAGKRACPPEDCGGPWGYQDLLEVLADPAHPDHAERKEWVGEDLSPNHFDPIAANAILAARFGRS